MSTYTKNGDGGLTQLCNGSKVSKSSVKIEVLGQIDELSTVLGCAHEGLRKSDSENIAKIQNDLFLAGSLIAEYKSKNYKDHLISRIAWMEGEIDRLEKLLPKLTHFILPTGSESSVRLQFARAVCRRCERALCSQSGNKWLIPYFNRLSDYLFVLARYENSRRKIKERELVHPGND